MHCILTALKAESDPIIKHFGLKRSNSFDFPVFEDQTKDLFLIGLGVGKRKIESRIKNFIKSGKYSYVQFINIGIAGSNKDYSEIGDLLLINKIIDESSNLSYYPDILIDHKMVEGALTTVEKVADDINSHHDSLVDMEASEIFKVCSRITPIHHIAFIKIVSDHMQFEQVKLTGNVISSLITTKLEVIKTFLENFNSLLKNDQPILSQIDLDWIHNNKRQLLLTETQTKQLTDKTKYYRLKNNKLPLPDRILIKPESKVVRKRIFTDICETLTK